MKKQIIRLRYNQLLLLFTWLSLFSVSLRAGHNTNRYLPFLEKPGNYLIKKNHYISPSSFLAFAAKASSRGKGSIGIPELWGRYDLNDVINSLAAVQGSTFVNPFLSAPGVEGLAGRSVIYKVDSRITAGGVLLDGSHAILGESLFIGYSIPLMRVRATHQYVLNQGSNDPLDTTDPLVKMLLPGEVNQVERVRQSVHTALGLEAQDWETGGFGDIDVHLRWQCHWDHVLLTRSIYSNFIAGVVFPTGVQIAKNNAVTVPFMGDGHWSLYLDGLHEVELKHDWKVGLLSSYMLQLSSTRERRLPVFKEPAPFSALIAKTEVDPGFTFKISPYITIENIIDGMHIQARYTYIQHSDDKWTDKRSDKTILSYLVNQAATGRTLTDVAQNIQTKKHNTSWRAQYFTFGLSYDTTASLKKWSLSPVFYINFDTPLANKGVAKTNQLTLGVELHF